MNILAAIPYHNPFILALIIIAVGALIYWFVGYMKGPEIFQKLVIGVVVVALVFLAITLLTGCTPGYGVSGRVTTPYGNINYSSPSDGKTVLEPQPSATPRKSWLPW